MRIGMLWACNSRPVEQSIADAATYYGTKYEKLPTLCFVNPKMLTDEQLTQAEEGDLIISKLKVRASRSVLNGHLWMGIE